MAEQPSASVNHGQGLIVNSSDTNRTPVTLWADSTTHRLLIDTGATRLTTGSNTGLGVAILDGSGNQITSFGGGTQYANGVAQATPTGTLALGYDGANLRAIKTDANGIQAVAQQDNTATGVINTTETVSIALNGCSTLGIILEGGFGGQINFEGSIDGGSNWFTANAFTVPGSNLQQTAGNAGQFIANVAGFSNFRIRGNTVNTSACTVFMRTSAGAANIIMNNGVINTNVQNFGIGTFGNSDGTNAGITSAIMWSGNLAFNGATFDRMRIPTLLFNIAAQAVTAATPVTVWTPTSGKKFRILSYALSLSVAGSVILKDNTTEFLRTPLMAAGVGQSAPKMGNGYISTAANNTLKIDVTATGSVSGWVMGVEE